MVQLRIRARLWVTVWFALGILSPGILFDFHFLEFCPMAFCPGFV